MILAALLAGAGLGWLARRAYERRVHIRSGRMLSFVAHELNTPLTAINMTVLNFISGVFGPLARDQQEWMGMMKEQVNRLNGVLGELRDFVHLEFQRDLRLQTEPADLREMLTTVLSQNESTVTRSGARLDLDIPQALPKVLADPERLQRALASVLAHARKFRKEGPIALSVRTDATGVETRVAFISNTTPAGNPERMLDLYHPISGKDSSQLLASVGTGLGLVRMLMELQGGSLGVTVDAAGATELRLRLPLA